MNVKFDVTNVKIETPRLILRAFRESDLEDFHAYAKVDGVGQPAGWLPHKSIDESRAILDGFLAKKREFAIVLRDTGRVVGSLGVKEYTERFTEFDLLAGAEIGYVLAKDCWGLGLMTEALRAVIDYLFGKENFDFLLCGRYDTNPASARVQEKCGFLPYRALRMETSFGTVEPGILNLLMAPGKDHPAAFSHPETLILEGYTRTAEELFAEFREATGYEGEEYEAWAFGGAPDKLASLVLRGEKTGTSSAKRLYKLDGEEIPKEGDLSVVLNAKDFAVAVIETVEIRVKPFRMIGKEEAFLEGEGDKSLAYWRTVHTEFFEEEFREAGIPFTEDEQIVFERFRVLYAASGRKKDETA